VPWGRTQGWLHVFPVLASPPSVTGKGSAEYSTLLPCRDSIPHVRLSCLSIACVCVFVVDPHHHHHHTTTHRPRASALPLRERTWIARRPLRAPDRRLSPNVVAWLACSLDSKGLAASPLPLLPLYLDTLYHSVIPVLKKALWANRKTLPFGTDRSASAALSGAEDEKHPIRRSQARPKHKQVYAIRGIETVLATCHTLERREDCDRSLRR